MLKFFRNGFVAMLVLLSVPEASAQEKVSYLCPDLGIRFTSDIHWTTSTDPLFPATLTLNNQNRNMQVSFWKISDSTGLDDYLDRLVTGNGLSLCEIPDTRLLNLKSLCLVCASGREKQCPFRYIFAAFPMKNGSLLIRIRCPEECYPDHMVQVNSLLKSVKILS